MHWNITYSRVPWCSQGHLIQPLFTSQLIDRSHLRMDLFIVLTVVKNIQYKCRKIKPCSHNNYIIHNESDGFILTVALSTVNIGNHIIKWYILHNESDGFIWLWRCLLWILATTSSNDTYYTMKAMGLYDCGATHCEYWQPQNNLSRESLKHEYWGRENGQEY